MDSSERCAVVGCEFHATGTYLYATRATAIRFAICDVHLADLMAGAEPEVIDDGHRPQMLIRVDSNGR